MRILLVGYGRSGKDLGGEWFQKHTKLRFAGTTSKYLAKYVAQEMGVSEEEAYGDRHQNRMEWKRIGDVIRGEDPGLLMREAFARGEVSGGIRSIPEVVEAPNICDLIVWVDNPRVEKDPTVDFSKFDADIIISNEGSVAQYYSRIKRLAKRLGVLK